LTGVHPDDWNNARDPINPEIRWSTAPYDDDDDRLGGGVDTPGRGGDRKGRKKNKNHRNKEVVLVMMEIRFCLVQVYHLK